MQAQERVIREAALKKEVADAAIAVWPFFLNRFRIRHVL